jgi:cobalt-zinc-cadmium efflux system protein
MPDSERRVFWAMVLTGGFMGIEVVGGLVSGSLALLADAGHMLTDFAALGLAWFAFRIARRPPDQRRSYGYHRIQVLAAFVNGIVLVAVVGWILVEAVGRLLAPVEVLGGVMLAVAVGGLLVNIAAFALLHGGDRDNINLRAAAIHVLGDLLGSAAAILAAGVILGTGWMPIDPLLSVLVALLILRSSWLIIKKSAHILLEGTPDWLDVGRLRADLVAQVPGVEDVHGPRSRRRPRGQPGRHPVAHQGQGGDRPLHGADRAGGLFGPIGGPLIADDSIQASGSGSAMALAGSSMISR